MKSINSLQLILKSHIKNNKLPSNFKIKYPDLVKDCLVYLEDFKDENIRINKQLIFFINNIFERPMCKNKNCKNKCKFQKTSNKFSLYCSHLCSNTDPEKDLITVTNNLQKYGVPRASMTTESKEKLKKTNLLRYGVTCTAKLDSIKLKAKKTCQLKYNHDSSSVGNIKNLSEYNNKEFIVNKFITNNGQFKLFEFQNYFNCSQVAAHNTLKRLKIKYNKFACVSQKEQALYPFLDSLNFIYETNVRNVIDNLELDIYFPELDLAIEYNGLYWHSYHEAKFTNLKQKNLKYMKYRHQAKSLACYCKGIRLLHIYEDTENLENLILDFLNYETEDSLKEPKSSAQGYELDSGCYPLGLEYEVIEPESRIVLGDRLLFNAGKIKTKGVL